MKLQLFILKILLISFSLPTFATTVLSINTEFFWDSQEPHEGQAALGAVGNPPSRKQVQLEAYAIAQVIMYNNADIVGLVEVEGENVVKQILNYLPDEYSLVFKKGRDGFTGQDVALITRYAVIGEPNNLKGVTGTYKGIKKTPSKALGIRLQNGSDKYYVVVAHLLSKRGDNDSKRAAQANSIVNLLKGKSDHLVVMGDINDVPDSETLKELYKAGLNIINKDEYSYVYNNKKQLIDHILVSDSLIKGALFNSFDLGAISDHRGVKAILKP